MADGAALIAFAIFSAVVIIFIFAMWDSSCIGFCSAPAAIDADTITATTIRLRIACLLLVVMKRVVA
jgi:hypothetical protein